MIYANRVFAQFTKWSNNHITYIYYSKTM